MTRIYGTTLNFIIYIWRVEIQKGITHISEILHGGTETFPFRHLEIHIFDIQIENKNISDWGKKKSFALLYWPQEFVSPKEGFLKNCGLRPFECPLFICWIDRKFSIRKRHIDSRYKKFRWNLGKIYRVYNTAWLDSLVQIVFRPQTVFRGRYPCVAPSSNSRFFV